MTPQEAAQMAPAPEASRPPAYGLGILKLAAPLLLTLFVLLLLLGASADAKLSDKRLCFDKDCSVPISAGRTTLPYNSKDRDVLSFPPNTEVTVYSKSSGSRHDLWGVEIQGKRGYAPARFIRELKIFHSDLNHTVPVEGSNDEPAKDDTPEAETTVQGSANPDAGPVQTDQIQPEVPEDALSVKQQDTISPDQVSPSYEFVNDGTPQPVDTEEEPPSPSYSTETVQEQPTESKSDEVVRLDVYPNILSSTFSALSDILGTGDGVSDESVEIDSSEKIEDQDAETEQTVEPPNESNLQEEQNAIPTDTATEDKLDAKTEEFTAIEPESVIGDGNSSVQSSSDVDSNELNPAVEFFRESGVERGEVVESKSSEVKVELDKVVESSVETPYLVDVPANGSTAEESLSSTSDTSKSNILEEQESVPEKVQDDDVPKDKKVVSVDNLVGTEDTASEKPIFSEELIFQPEPSEDLTPVDSAQVQKAIVLEVPLHEKVEEVSSTAPNEPFVPLAESFQPNLTDSHSVTSESIHKDLTDTPSVLEEKTIDNLVENYSNLEKQLEGNHNIVDSNDNVNDSIQNPSIPVYLKNDSVSESSESGFQSADSSAESIADAPSTLSFGGFLGNRNLLNAGEDSEEISLNEVVIEGSPPTAIPASDLNISSEVKKIEEVPELDEEKEVFENVIQTTIPSEDSKISHAEENASSEKSLPKSDIDKIVVPSGTCDKNLDCSSDQTGHQYRADENAVTNARTVADSSETLLYVCITAVTTLLFSLGYYFIESKRRDAYLIGKINNLEKDLMITKKECIMLDENFKSTKTKLDSIEDESFGSNEMVLSLKSELIASENTKVELEEQIASLEKELESTSEAGLELERMLREILSSQSDENNPLAKSIEDLQTRLNDQQVANESLMNALANKTQETETLTGDLGISLKQVEQLQYEVSKLAEELKIQMSARHTLEQTLSEQVQHLESQVKTLSEDKSSLRKQLKAKELEIKELLQVVEQINSNNLDFEKLYNAAHIKAENAHLLEELDELKIKLSEEQGAHQLLEEHAKLVQEEVVFLKDQCIAAEKEKKEAEKRLEVLTKFFEEKEVQRQKEEAFWLEKQGDVSSTVDRLHTLQNEILNYKQQIEMLRREILDQEREYKTQIATLETKAHEQWVAARQNERRLEEVKAESSQLRNRLTLVEKNINDGDPEVKLSRMQGSNGETAGGGHPSALYPGGEAASSSPLMFGPGSGPPLPPYMFPVPPPPVPFLPPPPPGELRPPPLGAGRLSSPPQLGPSSSSQASLPANHSASSPPPLSPPPPHMPFPPFPPSFASDHHHLPPPPLPPFHHAHQQHPGGWAADEAGPPPPPPQSGSHHLRNSNLAAFQRNLARNHKGSLHSSGESLDKSHHSGKV